MPNEIALAVEHSRWRVLKDEMHKNPELSEAFRGSDFQEVLQNGQLQNKIEQLAERSEQNKEKQSLALLRVKKALAQWQLSGGNDDLSQVCQALRETANYTEDDHLQETLLLFAEHLTDKVLSNLREEFEIKLHEQLRDLEKGGSDRKVSISMGLGAGLSALGLEAGSLTFGLEYTYAVKGGDDTKVREFHITNASTKLTGGNDHLASLSGTFGTHHAKGRVFRNLDDFIRFHSNDLIPVILGQLHRLPGNIKGIAHSREQRFLRHSVLANAEFLSQRLQEQGIMLPSEKVHVEIDRKPNYARFWEDGQWVKVSVSALEGVFEGSAKALNTVTRFRTRTELLKTLKSNPDKFCARKESFISYWLPLETGEYEKAVCDLWNSEYQADSHTQVSQISEISESQREEIEDRLFGGEEYKKDSNGLVQKRMKGKAVIAWIKEKQTLLQGNTLDDLEKRTIREKMKRAIIDQYNERDLYYFTLNALDGRIGLKTDRHRLAASEASFRKTYNVKNRGEYIEAHTFTYFRLWMTYMMTFSDGENPLVDDALFALPLEQLIEPTLTRPQVHLSDEKDVRAHLMVPSKARMTRQGVEVEVSAKIPGTSIKGAIHCGYSKVGKSTNPDNDGEYLNFSFILGAGSHLGRAIHLVGERLKQKGPDGKKTSDFRPELLSMYSIWKILILPLSPMSDWK